MSEAKRFDSKVKAELLDDETLRRLLSSCLYEIENLQLKIDNKEQQGWEGVRSRIILKEKLKNAIDALT